MARRVSLPAADDLFRPTRAEAARQTGPGPRPTGPGPDEREPAGSRTAVESPATPPSGPPTSSPVRVVEDGEAPTAPKRPSGRVRHDEKVTVYLTSKELHDVEHTRLLLRSEHGLGVDRGRLIREAVSVVLADFDAHGDESVLVRRLRQA